MTVVEDLYRVVDQQSLLSVLREKTGKYNIDFENMKKATTNLSKEILIIQGNGDYDGASKLIDEYGKISPELQESLDKVANAGIPIDITFTQGKNIIGLYY